MLSLRKSHKKMGLYMMAGDASEMLLFCRGLETFNLQTPNRRGVFRLNTTERGEIVGRSTPTTGTLRGLTKIYADITAVLGGNTRLQEGIQRKENGNKKGRKICTREI